MKIRRKFYIYTFFQFIITGIVIGLIVHVISKKIFIKQVHEHLTSVAQSSSQNVEYWLNNYKNLSKIISQGISVNIFLYDNNEKLDAAHARVTQIKNTHKAISGIKIINAKGIVKFSSSGELTIDISQTELFQKGREKAFLSQIYISKSTGKPVISSAVPIYSKDVFRGIIIIDFDCEKDIYKVLKNIAGLGETGELYLVNAEGYMISPSRFVDNVILNQKVEILNIRSALRHKNSNVHKQNEFIIYKDYRDIKVIGVHSYIQEMDWYLLAEMDTKEAFKPLAILFGIILFSIVIIIILVGIVSIKYFNRIVAPIEKLQKGAEEIINGNLNIKIKLNSNDELGVLADTFNKMTRKLQLSGKHEKKYSDILQMKIEESTAELQERVIESDRQRDALQNIANDLVESKARYEQLFENIHSGVAIYKSINNGENFILQSINTASEKMEKLSRQDIVGKLITDVFPDVKNFGLFEVMQKVWNTEKPANHPVKQYKDKRISSWRENYIYKLPTGEIICVYNDITDRKKVEEELDYIHNIYWKSIENADGVSYKYMFGHNTYEFISPKCKSLIGVSWQDITIEIFNKLVINVIVSDPNYTVDNDKYRELFKQGVIEKYWVDLQIKTFDGKEKWLSDRSLPVHDADGKVIGSMGILQDITQQKKIEENLRKSEKEYRQLVENAPIGIITSTIKTKFLSANTTFCNFTGYSEEELINISLVDLVENNTTDTIQKLINEELISGDVEYLKIDRQLVCKDNTTINILIHMFVQKDENGIPQYLVSLINDVTHENALENQLRQSQKMQAMGTLAGGIAHDFNNILQIIFGYLSIARVRGKDDEEMLSYLEFIQQASSRAMELVSQILTFSRQSEGTKKIISPSILLKQELKLIRSSIPPDININKKIDDNCGNINCNSNQFHQVVLNLCTNAYHAMDSKEGGDLVVELKEIEFESNYISRFSNIKKGKYAKLSIEDSGIGISEKNISRIFEPFFTTKEVGKGTGLGLSTVIGIIENHSGGIDVESKIGKGTKISIYYPIHKEKEVVENVNEDKNNLSGCGNVLFVDDEKAIVDVTKLGLSQAGYVVETKNNGLEALELFLSNIGYFDIIVSDYLMPDIQGVAVAKIIREYDKNIPILLYTGHIGKLDENELTKFGINSIIRKPLVISELVTIINKYVNKS